MQAELFETLLIYEAFRLLSFFFFLQALEILFKIRHPVNDMLKKKKFHNRAFLKVSLFTS